MIQIKADKIEDIRDEDFILTTHQGGGPGVMKFLSAVNDYDYVQISAFSQDITDALILLYVQEINKYICVSQGSIGSQTS